LTVRRQLTIAAGTLAAVVALLFAGKRILGNELSSVGLGAEAPDFSALTLDSVPHVKTLGDYRGSVVMINIWATWCGPCRVEMPSIEQLHKTYAAKGLKILAVSIDEPGAEAQIRDFVKQYGLTFQILYDSRGEITEKYQIAGYPETIIIGRDGVIRKKRMGASDWNSPENRGLVERLLADRAE
jgi:thiol-disulfide isomerase/thioredoxin